MGESMISRMYMNIRPNGRTMLAHVTLWFDMGLVVRGIQLHNKNGKYFIVWPQMVTSQGERYDTVYPDSKDKTEKILSEIVARYETLVSEETNEDNEMERGNDGEIGRQDNVCVCTRAKEHVNSVK